MSRPQASFEKAFVTGAAGFVASNLVDRLLAQGIAVVGYDNFSTGQARFLNEARPHKSFTLLTGDVLDTASLEKGMAGCDFVFHLAANADVRFGTQHPRRDLEQNTIATFNVLEAMRQNGIRRIAFSSTGSIYGEPEVFPTPEAAPFPIQTSLYGASKLAGESLIQAYCEGFGYQGFIFRFVSLLGERYSHGHVFDFCRQLLTHPQELKILGDGHQRKSYLYIQDCIEAMSLAIATAPEPVNIFNLGSDEYCEVNDSIGWICERMNVNPVRNYSGGKRGWVGDSPFIFLDCAKIRRLGWEPKLTIRQGIIKTVDYLLANPWLMEDRA
jgi:UDP-glucose 4-epimerase